MRKYINYLIILIVTIIIMIPMIFNDYLEEGHDASYHLANIYSIKEQISLGRWDSLILGNIANNFGYGTRIFYPPLSHTIIAFLSYFIEPLNLDVIDALKIVHFLTILISGLVMYNCAYKFSKNSYTSLFSAVIYITMPYFLSDIYIRCALGESFIFIFIPIIFSGVLSLLEGDVRHFYPLFIVGYVGGILSHLIMMVYFSIFLLIFLMVYYKKVLKKEIILSLFIASLFVVAIVLPYFESIISHKFLGNYVVFQDGAMADRIWNKALWINDYINLFRFNITSQEIRFYFPFFTMVILIFTIIFNKKINFPKYSKGFLIFGITAFWLSSIAFPWDLMPYFFKMIQFPWRLVTFVSFCISLLAPFYITVCSKKIIHIILIIGIIIGGVRSIAFPYENTITLDKINYNFGAGWQLEYLPVNSKNNLEYLGIRSHEIVVQNGEPIKVKINYDSVPNMVFEVTDLNNKVTIELPRLFYLGYYLEKDGKKIALYENSMGFLEAEIQENGTYSLVYKGTTTQNIARLISILTSISLIIFYIIKIKCTENSKNYSVDFIGK